MELNEKIQWLKDNQEKMTLSDQKLLELVIGQSSGTQPAKELILPNQKKEFYPKCKKSNKLKIRDSLLIVKTLFVNKTFLICD